MTRATILQLNRINQRFYQQTARSFAVTRQQPWIGWEQLRPFIHELRQQKQRPLRVLDVGCGEGRFGRWLAGFAPDCEYVGVDSSPELLELTKKSCQCLPDTFHTQFQQLDLVSALVNKSPLNFGNEFDLIVLFGVLHHIPSERLRLGLLEWLRANLAKDGLLVFTLWQINEHGQLKDRSIPPTELELDPAELEPGDLILDWQRDEPAYRYCHDFSDDKKRYRELENMTNIKNYYADGKETKSNYYVLLKNTSIYS